MNTASAFYQDQKELLQIIKQFKDDPNGLINKLEDIYKKNNLDIKDILGYQKIDVADVIDKSNKAVYFYSIGNFIWELSYLNLALSCWNYALKYFKEVGNIQGLSNCYCNIGIAYKCSGEYERSQEYYEKALNSSKQIGDISLESRCYVNMGNTYELLGEYNIAIEYQNKALKIKKLIGDIAGESLCYGNLGNAYKCIGEYDKAIDYQNRALNISKEIGDVKGQCRCYTNLSALYRHLNMHDKAKEYEYKAKQTILV